MLSPGVLIPAAAAVKVEDGELMYLELQVTIFSCFWFMEFDGRWVNNFQSWWVPANRLG